MINESVAREISTPDVESFLAKPEFKARDLILVTGLSRQTLKDYASRLGEPVTYTEEGQMFSRTVTARIFRLPIVRTIQSALNKLEVIHGQKVYTHPQVSLILGTEQVNKLLEKGNMSAIKLGHRNFYTHDMVENLQYLRSLEAKPAKTEELQVNQANVETEHGRILTNLSLQDIEVMQEKAKVHARDPNLISSWPRLGQLLGVDARSAQLLIYLGCQLSKQEAVSFNDFRSGESEEIPLFRLPAYLDALKNFLVENNLNLYDLFVGLKPINARNLNDLEEDSTRYLAFSTSTASSTLS